MTALTHGYDHRARIQAAPLALVAGFHIAALSALLFAKPELIRYVAPGVTYIDPIPLPKEPPPLPRDQPKAQPRTEIDRVTPLVSDPTPDSRADPLPPPRPPLPPQADPLPLSQPALVPARPDPRYAGRFQPPYPPRMERLEIGGVVVVRVLIAPDGRVRAVERVSGDEPAFFEATRDQALRHWRFQPATRDGVPIESWRQMTVRFEVPA